MSPRQRARRRLAHRSRSARRLAARLLMQALTRPEHTFDDGPDVYDRLIATASHLTGIPVSLIIDGGGDGTWGEGWAAAMGVRR